ncbi:hypothetical protein ABK040_013355 [Willaertia magna]
MSNNKITKDRLEQFLKKYKQGEDPIVRSFNIVSIQGNEELNIELIIDFYGLKEYKCTINRISEEMLVAMYDGEEEYLEINSAGASGLEKALEQFFKTLNNKREEFLLGMGSTPTSSQPQNKHFDMIDDDDAIMDDLVEDTLQDQLTCHVNDAKTYFGSSFVMFVSQLHNVRLNLNGSDISEDLKNDYRITNDNDYFTLSITFAPDYLTHDTPPRVQYKPEVLTLKSGFAEQIEHMLTSFIEMRWSQLKQDKNTKFGAADLKLSEFSNQRDKKESLIKQLIKKKKYTLARSLALYYSNMRPEKADELLTECGLIQQNHYSYENAVVSDSDPKTNFIMEMIAYLYLRMPSCHKFCCTCDDSIECYDLLAKEDIKPIICTKFKCQFDYVELGVCNSIPITICPASLHSDILENHEVVDILVSMCYSAATSSRRDVIFEPFPEQFNKMTGKNYDAVIKAIDDIPPILELKKHHCETETILKKKLSANSYEILKWILTTKRCAMVRMPEKKRIKEMQTEYQYLMMIDNPEKAAQTAANRKKYGSYWAFHGSAVENFHSILRRGLMNCSGTKMMTTGAAYGEGIYMAPDSSTSFGYSRVGSSWSKSLFGNVNNLRCIMICEVIKAPGVPTTPSPYYVVKQTEHVTTRFFLFYPSSNTNVSVMANNLTSLNDFVK